MFIASSARATITLITGAALVLALGLTAGARLLEVLVPGAPQGFVDLLAYYIAWWLVTGVIAGELGRAQRKPMPYERGLLLAALVMLTSLVLASVALRDALYPEGAYVNRGLQSIYLIVGAVLLPNAILGTIALWRGFGLSLRRAFILVMVWLGLMCLGLVVAAAVVQLVLVDMRRG
jgi:hypothetical protein